MSDMRQSEQERGFTLIELLVVIAVIAVLMAILMPTLRRVHRQARAVACRSNAKQWGTIIALSVNDNGGRFRDAYDQHEMARSGDGLWALGGGQVSTAMFHCPMAANVDASARTGARGFGGTFLPWCKPTPVIPYQYPYGSYGLSSHVGWKWNCAVGDGSRDNLLWRTIDVRGRDRIPALLDSTSPPLYWEGSGPTPPECDAIPTQCARQEPVDNPACINRHSGGVNALFLDWSVRKVGLKELWTLQWQKEYDTASQWTKAGGVEPQDWPQWMRGFKDY